MLTQLVNRKLDAYRIDLRLEDRATFQGPGLCTWDAAGARLLYTREVHRYRVLAGTADLYDPGFYDTEIAALAAADLPLLSAAQGDLLARLDRIPAADHIGEDNPRGTARVVEALAVDRLTGNWLVYSHRFVTQSPYVTDLAVYDPLGNPLSATTLPQPDDGTPPWSVPHALLEANWIYGLERDPHPVAPNTSGTPAPGRLVRRGIGTPATESAVWSPGDLYIYPHSVSAGAGSLWLATTKLFEPGTDTAYQLSTLVRLDPETLTVQDEIPLTFDLQEPPNPYYLGDWQSAGSPGGGICLFESWPEGGSPRFLASALTPNDYDEDWAHQPPTAALFRFEAFPPGRHLADLGAPLPTPMSHTPTGLVGNIPGELPDWRDL